MDQLITVELTRGDARWLAERLQTQRDAMIKRWEQDQATEDWSPQQRMRKERMVERLDRLFLTFVTGWDREDER